MCGIAGIWSKTGAPVTEESLRTMVRWLGHRGPDAEGTWFAPGLGLAHARLKILDLSDAANQPFTDDIDALVFNGEIFNHLELKRELSDRFFFKTHCDTEVLFRCLQLWGTDALAKLQGQFAFAFYRAAERTLLLARDHAGICPLYVLDTSEALYFASEIKPLLGFTRSRINPAAVKDYFAYRYNIQNGRTLFQGVERCHPAHFRLIHLDSRHMIQKRYWRLAFDSDSPSRRTAQDRFNLTFENEVASQSVADVDVGMFLSGGIDSGALLTGFSKVTPNIRAFTLAFTDRDDDYDYVKAMESGHHFSSRLITFPREFGDYLETVVKTLEDPFGDLIICANYVLAQEASRSVKVVLSGEGGDEAFCGYDHQRAFFRLEDMAASYARWLAIRLALRLVPARLMGLLQSYPGAFGTAERERMQRVNEKIHDPAEAYLELVRLFSDSELAGLFAPRFRDSYGVEADTGPIREIFAHDHEVWQAVMRAEIEQLTLIVNLLKQDRFCMAFSLEGRVPFVSKSILELAATLPYREMYSHPNKQLIQRYSGGIRTKKKPFSLFGTQEYLAALGALMDRYASEEAVRDSGILSWPAVAQLRAGIGSGSILAVKRSMAVVVFLVWQKVFQAPLN